MQSHLIHSKLAMILFGGIIAAAAQSVGCSGESTSETHPTPTGGSGGTHTGGTAGTGGTMFGGTGGTAGAGGVAGTGGTNTGGTGGAGATGGTGGAGATGGTGGAGATGGSGGSGNTGGSGGSGNTGGSGGSGNTGGSGGSGNTGGSGGSGNTGGSGGTHAGGSGGSGNTGGSGGSGGSGGGGGVCNDYTDCPDTGSECITRTCLNHQCGIDFLPPGTPLSIQVIGDCQELQCGNNGQIVSVADNADLPLPDGNPCTQDTCSNGAPWPPEPEGTSCNLNNGTSCDANATCVPSFIVVRLGTGDPWVSGETAPVFLDERFLTGALVPKAGNPVALPTTASGNQRALTLQNNSSTEGNLLRSTSGGYVSLIGYDSATGVAGVGTSSAGATNRVVGRVDALGNVDTTTNLTTAFTGNTPRAALTADGTAFWMTGNSSSGAQGGVQYVLFGHGNSSSQVLATPNNSRSVGIFGGQLYASSGSANWTDVFTVGTGIPTSTGQTGTNLAGMATTGADPEGFALLDVNANVAGVDLMYVADDRSIATAGGIQKWTFNGTTWTLVATYGNPLLTQGVRDLTAFTYNNVVYVLATTVETPARVVLLTDDLVNPPTLSALVSAALNQVFRGVALAPR